MFATVITVLVRTLSTESVFPHNQKLALPEKIVDFQLAKLASRTMTGGLNGNASNGEAIKEALLRSSAR